MASKGNGELFTECTQYYKDKQDTYRKMAEARRQSTTYKQERLYEFYTKAKKYINERELEERPLTISGCALEIGITKNSFLKARQGDFDYRLYEYMDLKGITEEDATGTYDGYLYYKDGGERVLLCTYSEIFERIHLRIEAQAEERLYTKGRVGDIFALKAKHKWQEEENPKTVNQTLVIASEEQARKAIDLLK